MHVTLLILKKKKVKLQLWVWTPVLSEGGRLGRLGTLPPTHSPGPGRAHVSSRTAVTARELSGSWRSALTTGADGGQRLERNNSGGWRRAGEPAERPPRPAPGAGGAGEQPPRSRVARPCVPVNPAPAQPVSPDSGSARAARRATRRGRSGERRRTRGPERDPGPRRGRPSPAACQAQGPSRPRLGSGSGWDRRGQSQRSSGSRAGGGAGPKGAAPTPCPAGAGARRSGASPRTRGPGGLGSDTRLPPEGGVGARPWPRNGLPWGRRAGPGLPQPGLLGQAGCGCSSDTS